MLRVAGAQSVTQAMTQAIVTCSESPGIQDYCYYAWSAAQHNGSLKNAPASAQVAQNNLPTDRRYILIGRR